MSEFIVRERDGVGRRFSKPSRKKLNHKERCARKADALWLFLHHASRKAQRGQEPNDRHYDNAAQNALRRMDPVELYRLLTD